MRQLPNKIGDSIITQPCIFGGDVHKHTCSTEFAEYEMNNEKVFIICSLHLNEVREQK